MHCVKCGNLTGERDHNFVAPAYCENCDKENQYRMLKEGETIQSGDQYHGVNGWRPVSVIKREIRYWMTGKYRRKIK